MSDLETAFVRLLKTAIDMKSLALCSEQRAVLASTVFGFLNGTDAQKAADAMSDRMGQYADAIQLAVSQGFSKADAVIAMLEFERDDAISNWKDLRDEHPCRFAHPINDPNVRDSVWRLTNGKCAYCDGAIYRDGQSPTIEQRFVVEHVVPTSMGGPDNLANYVPACMSCNSSKGDRHVLTLIRKIQKRQLDLVVDNQELPERMA